jgi:hypothetical protein
MHTSSKLALGIVAVIVAGLIGYHLLFPPIPSDQQQIRSDIQSAAQAAQNRNISGIMAVISDHYVDDNGLTSESLQIFLARALRDAQSVTITMSPSDIAITGDTATSTTYVSVSADTPEGAWTRPRQEVVLTWKKEHVSRFLVIPAVDWRITSASYGGLDME